MFREEKRLVSMLLCIALLLTMLPVSVFAQESPITFQVEASAQEVADPTIPERPSSKDEPDRPSSKDEPDRPSSKDEPDRPSSKDEADTCQHSYSSNITVTPTCTNAGLVTYTCSHCGDSYTEELTAYGHEMKQGACIRCGYATEVPLGSYFRGTVIASRTEAQVGDVIDFTVYGYGDSMAELNFGLSIPQGLGYIPGSAVCPDSLKELPGWASAKWDEASMQWACDSDRYADLSWNTVLLTFSCTVEMPGTYDIGLADVFASTNPFDGYSFSIITVDETVTVTGTPESGSDYTRIYCKTAASWTACKVHWWGSDDAPNTTWPGADMTKDRNGIWTIEVPADAAGLVLNNGKGTQSKDQKVPTDSNNMYDFAAATWTAYSVTEPPTTAPADGEVLVRIKASDNKVAVGDTIDFTVSISAVTSPAMEFCLAIPQGLSFISGSGVCLSKSALGENEAGKGWIGGMDWTEDNMMWTAYNDFAMTFPEDCVLLTFSCMAVAKGTYEIGLEDIFVYSGDYDEYKAAVVSDAVNVTGECTHDYIGRITTQATCVTAGERTYICSFCGDSYTEEIPATGHSLTYVDATVTCTKAGNIAHYTCHCGKLFADVTALVELTKADLDAAALGHVDDDYDNVCDRCGLLPEDPTEPEPPTTAPADGEVLVRIKASDNKVAVGDTIDFTLSISTVTSPAMDFMVVIPEGLRFVSDSGVCLSKSTLGKNEADRGWTGGMDWTEDTMMWTAYNDFAMTFPEDCVLLTFSCIAEAEGTYEIGLEDIFVYSGDYDEYKAAVVSDAVNVTGECTHDYIGRITTQATCDTVGEKTYTCSLCGDSYSEEIPATGHSLTYVAASVTCTGAGNIDYYTCHCGKLFADATALVELTAADLAAEALGHIDEDNDDCCDRCALLLEEPTEPEPPTTAPAEGEVLLRIRASDNVVEVGDTINFTVSISAICSPAIEFQLCIPEGLTFVPGSGDALDKAALGKNDDGRGWTGGMDWTEKTMYFTAYNYEPMVFPEGSVLLSFSCYVDLPGTYEIGLVNAYPYEGYDYNEPEVTVVSDVVTATGSSACTHSNLTHVDATVTCTEAGNKAHYICACGKMFEDVTGLIEITEADLAVEALGHSFVDGVCKRCDMPEVMPEPPFFRAAVKASKTEAQIGDVIDYVVYGYGDLITSLEFNLVIPAGMSYVKGSGVCPNDLADYLDWVAAEWTESSMMWTGYNDFPAFFEWNTVLLTFSCVVEKPGIYNIDLADFYACDEDFGEVFPMVLVDTVTVSCPDDSHSWLPATCLAPETCEYCGVTRGEIGTQHQYAPTVVAPSCEADGYTLHVCAVCQDSYTDTPTPATGHDHQLDRVVPPGCTEEGYTIYTCHCGDSYTDAPTPATGHDHWLDRVIPPGCTEEGYTIYTCHCGDSYETDKTQPLGHNENLSVLMPTCTAEGSNIYTCSRCGNRRYEAIPATGHSYRTSRVEPTCTEDGCYRNDCSQCGDYQIISTIPATGHSYQAQMTAPTCTEAGYTTHTCHCGYYYIDSYTQPLGHEEQCVTLAATCTTAGSNTYTCIRCGNERFQVLPATGHSYVTSWVEPTCTEIGGDRNDCTKCDSSFFISIAPATGHRYKAVVTPPTATEGGYTTHTCHCGDSYVDSYTEPLGMTLCGNFETFLEGTVTLELVKDGKTEYTVSVSGTTGSYELTGVLPGSYTLRVSKDLHVTREYEVTVEVNCAPVDVKLHRPGDINGDGRITVADVSKTYAHSKKAALLTGYEFLVADINGDSRITVADASKLYAHNKKVAILW